MRGNQYRVASVKLELLISLRLIKDSCFVNFNIQNAIHIMGSLKHKTKQRNIYIKYRTDKRKMTRVSMFEIQ